MSQEVAVQDKVTQAILEVRGATFNEQLAHALPGNVPVERFTRFAVTALREHPELANADRRTLFNAIVRCAQDGLLPDGREAALVVYSGKVQYQPMIGGLRKIAADHGISLEARVVYERDEFDYALGENPWLEHKPVPLGAEKGDPIGAYAVGTGPDGRKYIEVMDRDEIEEIRAVSRAGQSEYGPWVKHWSEMARKTVAKRGFKQLPIPRQDDRRAEPVYAGGRVLKRGETEALAEVGAFTPPAEGPLGEPDSNRGESGSPSDPDEYEPVEGEIVDAEVVGKGGTLFPIPDGARADAGHEDRG